MTAPTAVPTVAGWGIDLFMRSRTACSLAGVLLAWSLLAHAAGPGPGCSNTAECGCLRGNPSACEALAAQNPALAQEMQAARAAYEAAASGGRNAGFLRNAINQKWGTRQIQKSIKNLGEHVTRHEGYLKNPVGKVPDWARLTPAHQQRMLVRWTDEIVVAKEQIGILRVLWASM